jgi:hypothetical protein
MSDRPVKLNTSALLALAPYLLILGASLTLIFLAPRDIPLYEDGSIKNGMLAAGILLSAPLAFSSARPLARLVEKLFELLNR